jgi:uncharacterized protein YjdB
MKKSLLFAGLAAATLSFAGCNKEADVKGLDATPMGIILTDASTRTVNDGLSTKWEDGDALNVFYAPAGSTDYSENIEFTVDDAAANHATGSADLTAPSYDWYLLYPYSSYIKTPANTSSGYLAIGSQSNKTQTQAGLNSTAHLAGANLPVWGVAKDVEVGVTPKVAMKHVSSVVKVTVTNALDKAITVSSISLTAPEDIVGTYYIDFSGDTPAFKGSGKNYVSATATLEVTDAEALAPGASASFYMAVKPFTAAAESELAIKVLADAGTFEKTVVLDKETEFKAGFIKTLNVSYSSAQEFETITIADIKDLVKGGTGSSTAVSFEGKLAGAVVTFVSGRNAFIQDETAGILFYNNSNPFKVGDKLEGVVSGSGYAFNGLKEVTTLTVETVTPGQAVPAAVEMSLEELNADYDRYESVLVTLKDVTVTTAFDNRNATMTDGDVAMNLRDQKNGLTIDPGVYDITGFPSYYNAPQFGVWEQDAIVKGDAPFLNAVAEQSEVSATTTSVKINVSGNVAWTAEASPGATLDKEAGEGTDVITVSFAENTDPNNAKEYTVFVRTDDPTLVDAGQEEFEINITQAKADAADVTTVSTTMEAYAKAHECTISEGQNVTNYKELQLDDVVTMSTTGEGNCGSFWYTTGTQWRLYQNKSGNVVISLASGYKLKSVSFVYDVTNTGTLKDAAGTVVASGDVYETDASTVEFIVGNTSSSVTNGQVRITEVTIKYEQGEGTTPTLVDPTVTIPSTLTVVKGETATIEVTTNSNGAKTWTSSDETVATVDNNGVVTGVKAGTATVTLSIAATSAYNAATAQIAVTVTEPAVGGNTLSMTMDEYVEAHNCTVSAGQEATMYTTLQLNESVRLSTTGAPNCGSFWNTSSSNTTKQWRLYQNQGGNAIVTVAEGCELVSVKFTYANSNNGVLKDAEDNQVKSGTTVSVSGSSVTYTVGNTGDATNGQVRVTAVEIVYTGNGTTFPDQPSEITTTISLPSNHNVYVGETFALNASSNVAEATITYESEDPSIATVDASGVVTGVAEGTVKVYARIAGVEGKYTDAEKYCNVTVTTKPVETEGTVVFDQTYLAANKDGSKDVISYTNSSDYNGTVVTELRIYKGKDFVVSASGDYKITSIKMTCTAKGTAKQGPGCWGAGAPEGYTFEADGFVGTWTGSASSVSFTATDNQVRITELVVTYE